MLIDDFSVNVCQYKQGDEFFKVKQLKISRDLRVTSTARLAANGDFISSWEELAVVIDEFVKSSEEENQEKAKFDEAIHNLKEINPERLFPNSVVAFTILLDLLASFTVNSKNALRYSLPTIMVMMFVNNISTASYEYLSEIFRLPSVRHLIRMANRLNTKDTKSYLTTLASNLSPLDLWVSLSVDGISVVPKVQLSNGQLRGLTEDGEVATQMIGFMVNSIFGSKIHDMVQLQEYAKVSATDLAGKVLEIIKLVESCGLKVLLLISDNHQLNVGMFKKLMNGADLLEGFPAFLNPCDTSRPIFIQFDSTHLPKKSHKYPGPLQVFRLTETD